jgi:hypothetical protein
MKSSTAILFYLLALKCNKLPRPICDEPVIAAKKIVCSWINDVSNSGG